jgi:hypothetical protein
LSKQNTLLRVLCVELFASTPDNFSSTLDYTDTSFDGWSICHSRKGVPSRPDNGVATFSSLLAMAKH